MATSDFDALVDRVTALAVILGYRKEFSLHRSALEGAEVKMTYPDGTSETFNPTVSVALCGGPADDPMHADGSSFSHAFEALERQLRGRIETRIEAGLAHATKLRLLLDRV